MDGEELLKRYVRGERDFFDLNLRGVYLLEADLSEACLSETDLSGANLSRSNLIKANLCGADLSGGNLNRADLCGANLCGADLSGGNLNRADLCGADLCEADLNRADLSRANLRGADLYQAVMVGTDLNKANLRGANLCRANLQEANLSKAQLRGVNLREANLIGANLTNADLTGANLIGVSLNNAYLGGAILDQTILADKKISEDLQRENQDLKEKLSFLETQFEKLVERQVERRLIANQGIKANKLTWEGMRFRSKPEREIAKVLDKMAIMFFPLPSGRVMTEEGMATREVDFLICSRGLWGILECDGEMWHPSAAKDHKRDNDYKRHGLWFIQRFTDKECKITPLKVVRQFLDMLHKFHEDQHYLLTGSSVETDFSLPID